VYIVNVSGTEIWVFVKDIFHTYFKAFRCIYRVCSNRSWCKHECGIILQLIIQFIYFKVYTCIYRIISNRT